MGYRDLYETVRRPQELETSQRDEQTITCFVHHFMEGGRGATSGE